MSSRRSGTEKTAPRRVSQTKLKQLETERREEKKKWTEKNIAPLEHIIHWGVPPNSLLLYARWWQLERWLRDLVQLELHARFGRSWEAQVLQVVKRRNDQLPALQYMPSSDDGNTLGFADLGNLSEVILEHWSLFSYALLPQARWIGTLDTLKAVRRRIAHCRMPHRDDLSRVEQALRDLERGSKICLESYSCREWLNSASDEIYAAFSSGGIMYQRVNHALNRYDTTMLIRRSTRPWSSPSALGTVYHAEFNCGNWAPAPQAVWEYLSQIPEIADLIHLTFNPFSRVMISFVPQDPSAGVDLIDGALEAILTSQHPRSDVWYDRWSEMTENLDYRVRCNDYFANAIDLARIGINFSGSP